MWSHYLHGSRSLGKRIYCASKPSCVDMILNHPLWFIFTCQEKFLHEHFSIKDGHIHHDIYWYIVEHLFLQCYSILESLFLVAKQYLMVNWTWKVYTVQLTIRAISICTAVPTDCHCITLCVAVLEKCESNTMDHWWWKNGRSICWGTIYSFCHGCYILIELLLWSDRWKTDRVMCLFVGDNR